MQLSNHSLRRFDMKTKSVRLNLLAKFHNGKDWKAVESSSGEYPVYGSGGIFGSASQYLHDGEAVLFGRKGTVDKPLYVSGKFWTVDTMYYAVPNEKILARYLHYWATTIPFSTITTQTALPSVTQTDLSLLSVPYYSVSVQREIVAFLDRETAKIDSLVANIDKYVEVLGKLQARVIVEALNLDQLPCSTIGRHAQVSLGKTLQAKSKSVFEVEMPYVRAGNIQPGGRLDGEIKTMWFNPAEVEEYALEAGDVLVVEGGSVGRSLTLSEELEGWGFQNHVIRVRPHSGWSGKYIDYTIRAHKAQGLIDLLAVGATIQGLSAEKLKKLPIAFRTLEQQCEVVDFIDERLGSLDAQITNFTKLRDILVKRRAALITEVVTGQREV
ncbi:hypothetical protein CPHO_00495 [Corynebacterium phocae]|uniref:Type I restriction modification DNA specificity domain-containing protein n=2 Tax=Corynebacterium phocae TaxID=161895 RepID=A0A1L7D5W9_9CORY|nr:hypothetical protein CPHO_00495 [Corynebacterium phocae]